jgi:hypothetical protein
VGILVLQKAISDPRSARFDGASTIEFPDVSMSANVTTPASKMQVPLPANVKVIAVSAIATVAGSGVGAGLGINIASGPAVGTFRTGTITFSGTAGVATTGSVTMTIAGPTGYTQTVTAAILDTYTATQSAAALVAAINSATNPQVFATNSAGVVTLHQLATGGALTGIGTAQTYKAALTGVTTQTVSPTTATAFTGTPTSALGTPDTTYLGIVPSTTAASGQLLLPQFASIPVAVSGSEVNTVVYPPQVTGPGYNVNCWDIIFPVTRSLALIVIFTGYDGSNAVTLRVRALVVPYILDPTQLHAQQWQPNNSTIGAPSTD